MKKFVFLLLMVLMAACGKEFLEVGDLGANVGIIGTWIEEGTMGDTTLLKRAGELDEHKYGFVLKQDGTFIERKNSGWCGTPPIAYADYEGAFEVVSDSLLSITVAYWGGMMTYQIRVLSLGTEDLAIKYLYSEDMAKSR